MARWGDPTVSGQEGKYSRNRICKGVNLLNGWEIVK